MDVGSAGVVKFYKARRYQLFPTPEQETLLRMWATALIPLWNDGVRAVEHNRRLWRMGVHKPKSVQRGHIYRLWQTVKKELPDHDWSRIGSDIVGALSQRFDDTIDRMYRGDGRPRFKHPDRGLPGLEFPVWKKPTKDTVSCAVVLGRDSVKFPNPGNRKELGLGRVKYDRRQKLKGRPKTATIVYDAGKWFLSVACEIAAKPQQAADREVGIDIGVAQHLTTSEGEVIGFIPPQSRERLFERMKKAQRRLSRSKKGSHRRRRVVAAVARAHSDIAHARQTAQHTVARQLVNNYGTIAVEDLKVRNMTRSAKGDAEVPGKNVRAKSGLNREMLNVAPRSFRVLLEQKIARTTGKIIPVDPRHTSQTCSKCGVTDASSRRSQSEFVCVACGYADNADLNAARNILSRARSSGASVSPRKTPSRGRRAKSNVETLPLGQSRPESITEITEAESPKTTQSRGLT